MELLTLSLFCLALLACLISGVSILFALAAGLVLFLLFGRKKGFSWSELFSIAAEAAKKGAENSKNFVSKFGRAKTYGAKTIGTPDAGAMSMAKFFEGLAKE